MYIYISVSVCLSLCLSLCLRTYICIIIHNDILFGKANVDTCMAYSRVRTVHGMSRLCTAFHATWKTGDCPCSHSILPVDHESRQQVVQFIDGVS